jgi:hypothetical protein
MVARACHTRSVVIVIGRLAWHLTSLLVVIASVLRHLARLVTSITPFDHDVTKAILSIRRVVRHTGSLARCHRSIATSVWSEPRERAERGTRARRVPEDRTGRQASMRRSSVCHATVAKTATKVEV